MRLHLGTWKQLYCFILSIDKPTKYWQLTSKPKSSRIHTKNNIKKKEIERIGNKRRRGNTYYEFAPLILLKCNKEREFFPLAASGSVLLNIIRKFTRKHTCWSLYLIKLQACIFIKKRLHYRYFLVNIAKFKNNYSEIHLRTTTSVFLKSKLQLM